MDRVILHCDLNNFFASVECAQNEELKDYPIAVCGSVEDRHGIVLAKNERAKRYGVKTAEVIWQAKLKCPDLVTVPPHMDEYIRYSHMARKIYAQYTDLVEPFGIDECWLDVTESQRLFGSGCQIANQVRRHIKRELGLTVSVGVSFTKVFAKLGSDLKKPDAVTCINRDNYQQLVWPMAANNLIGIGNSTYTKLNKYGIESIGDLAKADPRFLKQILGKNGEALSRFANGIESERVGRQDAHEVAKSIGNSTTCPEDLTDEWGVWRVLYQLCESVGKRLRQQDFLAESVQISVKDNSLSTREFQGRLPYASRSPRDLADAGMTLFRKHYDWKKPIRMVGIRAINLLENGENCQYSLLYDQERIQLLDRLEQQVFNLRSQYGDSVVFRGSLMGAPEAPPDSKYDQTSLPGSVFGH